MNHKRRKRFFKIIVIAILAIPLFGFLLMSLWNWLMPALFALPHISFWQALGVFFLSRILFGGFGGDGGRRHRHRMMMERWEQMTPEERERFRAGLEARA
ncbi:MAG TPA: hypothetical protein VM733_22205 [Thermoanaerobaculia bacterium]|nr:hypothetical protein [Thermoanaerobaculia bacterium]